jgi:CheY-like chemotaxis protein
MPKHVMRNSLTSPSPPPACVQILVVDDDEDPCETLVMALDIEGYQVTHATSAAEALTYLRAATSSHMVLLDYALWGGNAETLLCAAEHDPRVERHRYALMSDRALSQFSKETKRLLTVRCTGFLRKPFDLEHLLEEVEWAVAHLPVTP